MLDTGPSDRVAVHLQKQAITNNTQAHSNCNCIFTNVMLASFNLSSLLPAFLKYSRFEWHPWNEDREGSGDLGVLVLNLQAQRYVFHL
ncbi:hypothetical protein Nepgr_015986 [Nepenthes gracilis]|uniref:Uncharacterized protein n=1 Tax=Nepenthes gracilis TaxID=150966 RepID=A0AAD3XS43_NEPGR|nr:hypothetical protein Nepgr_015986 [Nepenthes gracilis]